MLTVFQPNRRASLIRYSPTAELPAVWPIHRPGRAGSPKFRSKSSGHRVDADHGQLQGVYAVGYGDDVGAVGNDMGGPGAVPVGRQQHHRGADQCLIDAGADCSDPADALGAGDCGGLQGGEVLAADVEEV
jgi:hypothetical protein